MCVLFPDRLQRPSGGLTRAGIRSGDCFSNIVPHTVPHTVMTQGKSIKHSCCGDWVVGEREGASAPLGGGGAGPGEVTVARTREAAEGSQRSNSVE